MNSATLQDPSKSMEDNRDLSRTDLAGNEFAYRSISKAAIASLIFGVLGALTSFLAAHFVILPALALIFGFVALSSFRKFPEELTGKLAAKIGIVLGLVCVVAASVFHTYVYNTEVPDGYQRISYGELRPNSRTGLPFSEKAREFDGKKVFLKGYVRPSAKRRKLKNFILVGDFGDCCFGGNPEMTDVVAIKILGDETIDHGYSLRKIGGTFHLNEASKRTSDEEVPLVFYEIEADHIR
jgi:hypothetical protein